MLIVSLIKAILTTEPVNSGKSTLKHVVSILLEIGSSHSIPGENTLHDTSNDPFKVSCIIYNVTQQPLSELVTVLIFI